MDTLLIYVPKLSPRARYVFRLLFHELLWVKHELTTDVEAFEASHQPKFSYADQKLSDELFFRSSGLLFQKGVDSLIIETQEYQGEKGLFPVFDKTSDLPFDLFASVFYLISRYEEYLPYIPDRHGRFTAHLSISVQLGFLEKPMVNIWAQQLKQILIGRYPKFAFPERKFRFTPTYDIDAAFAYAQKGLVRSIGSYYLDLKQLDFKSIIQRSRVLLGREKDPFDTFDLQLSYQKRYKLHPIYFFLFGHYGQFDKNINTRNRSFRFLIKKIGDYAKIGIHPSYLSNEDTDVLAYEISNLERVVNKEVTRSRQHFLKLNLPTTYRKLIENRITDDYTMGYAALPGFRAGICNSFNFYDLDVEAETKLRIHPITVMDGTLNDYMELTPADAIAKIAELMKAVKQVNGNFISLWHNESLSDQKRWTGWLKVYEELLKMAHE